MYMLFSQTYNILLVLSQQGRVKKEQIKYDLRVVYGEPPVVAIAYVFFLINSLTIQHTNINN